MLTHQRKKFQDQDNLAQWQIRALITLLCSASLILFIGQYTDIDLKLADFYFDTQEQFFPWDKTWFGRGLMHGWIKNIVVWMGFLIMLLTLFDLAFPLSMLSLARRAGLRILSLSAVLEPLLIKTLKEHSSLHCPWGIDRYGGQHPFLRLLDAVPSGWSAGHCFPAGHASSAMWLVALAVLFLPHNPRRAFVVFIGGLGAGLALGWVQQMRGQHFLTHTLWTAWLSSALVTLLIAIFFRQLCVQDESNQSRGQSFAYELHEDSVSS